MPLSQQDIVLDWCYDKSVCQTRTVTSFYAAVLLLAAAYAGRAELSAAVHTAAAKCEAFQQENRDTLAKAAALPWDNVVVLADGPCAALPRRVRWPSRKSACCAGVTSMYWITATAPS